MPSTDLLSAIGALGLVIGLIVLLRFGAQMLASRRKGRAPGSLQLVGQLVLDGRRRLHLVQCGGDQVLLLTGGATDVMLSWPTRAGHSS